MNFNFDLYITTQRFSKKAIVLNGYSFFALELRWVVKHLTFWVESYLITIPYIVVITSVHGIINLCVCVCPYPVVHVYF